MQIATAMFRYVQTPGVALEAVSGLSELNPVTAGFSHFNDNISTYLK